MEKKKYLVPNISVIEIGMNESCLVGPFKTGISEEPATEPAASKEFIFLDDEFWEEPLF